MCDRLEKNMKVCKSFDRRQFINIFLLKIASIFFTFGNLLFLKKNAGADEGNDENESRSRSIGTGRNGSIENAEQWQDTENAFYDGKDGQDYGIDQLHEAFAAAADSAAAHGHGSVGITAISVDGGGNMPGSNTHQNGTCYDFRYFGNDGDAHNINDSTYSRDGTEDFIREAHEQHPVVQVVTGDSILVDALSDSGISDVRYDSGDTHDNHVHLQFANPNAGGENDNGGDENGEKEEKNNEGGG